MICRTSIHRYLISVILLALLPIAGCAGDVTRKWSEDVQLDNATVIVVDRYVKFSESNSLSGDAYSTMVLKSALSFRNDLAEMPAWSFPLVPLLLYRDEAAKELAIVATSNSCDVWAEWGSPSPPYWEFRLQAGKWVKTGLSTTSEGRKSNLFFEYEPSLPARRLSIAAKEQAIKGLSLGKKYRSIRVDIKSNCTPQMN